MTPLNSYVGEENRYWMEILKSIDKTNNQKSSRVQL